MKHMHLRHDAVIAGYDDIRCAASKGASQIGERRYSAIRVDLTNAGDVGQGMTGRTDSSHLAALPLQGRSQTS
jgi:hypothetical protein